MLTRPMTLSPAMKLTATTLSPASTNGADPPPRSSSSRVLLQMTRALDLSVRPRRLVDDPNGHAIARQLGGHRHPDRTGTDDQNRLHRSFPQGWSVKGHIARLPTTVLTESNFSLADSPAYRGTGRVVNVMVIGERVGGLAMIALHEARQRRLDFRAWFNSGRYTGRTSLYVSPLAFLMHREFDLVSFFTNSAMMELTMHARQLWPLSVVKKSRRPDERGPGKGI